MENEAKKGGCCEGKGNCEHAMANCCHHMKKCHMMRKIIWIVIIILAFSFGSEWGEMKGQLRGNDGRFERGGMMNWGQNKFYNNDIKGTSDSVTVKVAEPAVIPAPKQ